MLARRLESFDRVEDGDVAWLHQNGACFLVDDAVNEQLRTIGGVPCAMLLGTDPIDALEGQLVQAKTQNFQDIIKRHMMMIMKYPHNKLGKGRPYEGIENLRPEIKMAVETFMSWQPPPQ